MVLGFDKLKTTKPSPILKRRDALDATLVAFAYIILPLRNHGIKFVALECSKTFVENG